MCLLNLPRQIISGYVEQYLKPLLNFGMCHMKSLWKILMRWGNTSMKSFLLLVSFSDAFFSDMQCDDISINELAMGGTLVSDPNSCER